MLVPAAGCGARAALNGNKILADLSGRPLLSWTIEALLAARPDEIIVACRRAERAAIRAAFDAVNAARAFYFGEDGAAPAASLIVKLVDGGASRQDSVMAGVMAARGDLVIVHDAARPCVSAALLHATIEAARASGAAIAALPCSDAVKRAAPDGTVAATLDRSEIWLAQTPQVFRRAPFLAALQAAAREGWQGTDCASILEHFGAQVTLVPGESDNLKVTYAADLARAAAILARR